MRRLAILALPVLALVLPATALALHDANTADGTLVVKNGSAPRGVPVVTLSIEGTAIGHISTGSPDQVDTAAISDTKTKFVGSDFRFRAAGGVYKIWIYGSGVDVFAVGAGKVTLQGLPDSNADGRYSINGGDWRSLPAAPSDLLQFGSSG